jgi:hypothetical protein
VLFEEAAQMTAPDADTRRKGIDVAGGKASLGDEIEGSSNRVRRAAPPGEARRHFGPTSKTGAEAGRMSGRRAPIKFTVAEFRRARWARGSAKDPGADHSRVKAAIESTIPRAKGFVAPLGI